MPANQKHFENLKRETYDNFRQQLRAKGWVAPYNDSGYLRSNDGLLADMSFDEVTGLMAVRIRDVPKGHTYPSILGQIEEVLQRIGRS